MNQKKYYNIIYMFQIGRLVYHNTIDKRYAGFRSEPIAAVLTERRVWMIK